LYCFESPAAPHAAARRPFVSASRWCRFGCRSRVRTTASPVSRLGTWRAESPADDG